MAAGGGGREAVEVRFRLDDGSDIGPSMHDPDTTVPALKEFVLARWPQGKEITPRTVNDVTIINAGKVLQNNRTLAESRNLAAEAPGGPITMHVVVRKNRPQKSEKQPPKAPQQNGCGCAIL